jgi:ABC-2 type transport system ATP-binding protein
MVAYEIYDLVKIFPGQSQPANDHINLQIQAGEIFGFLGDNGAGKTTLVRQMANLLQPTSGKITLFDHLIGRDPLYVPCWVGYMPQDGLALNNLTVAEAICFTAHLRGLDRSSARSECNRLMEVYQLGSMHNRPSTRLSGGQKRLLQLAVALAAEPSLLILDEPTTDLDPLWRNQVWQHLRDLNRMQGTTIIFITHDAIEAEKIIQRVGIIHQGKLVAVGKPANLKATIDKKLRLELFFNPSRLPRLPGDLAPIPLDSGRWLIYLDREQAGVIINSLDMQQVDDFRLYTPTLEDLYLYYAS